METKREFENIYYKRNYLTEVIIRVDLLNHIEAIEKELPKNINSVAMHNFSIAEPRDAFIQRVEMSSKRIRTDRKEFSEWVFHSRDRGKSLIIGPQWFYITCSKYDKYENLKEDFIKLCNDFFKQYEEAQFSRLGIRYINSLKINKDNPLDWSKYINKKLLGLFNLSFENAKPSRIFHNFELNFSDFNLRFQFGMHNPDYPAQIKQNIFILDFDAYYQGLIEPKDVSDCLDQYHIEIQNLFEFSITDNLRGELNE
ncbi:TIGR04255 family protein [bacterium]|nr:TIGR04255 family protein [FCB group bacterium]MBL7191084.1 TIGR04255 family protein [bacterium]